METPLKLFNRKYPFISYDHARKIVNLLEEVYSPIMDEIGSYNSKESVLTLIEYLFSPILTRKNVSYRITKFPLRRKLSQHSDSLISELINLNLILEFGEQPNNQLVITPEGLIVLKSLNNYIEDNNLVTWSKDLNEYENIVYNTYKDFSLYRIRELEKLISKPLSKEQLIILLIILISNPCDHNGLEIEAPNEVGVKIFDKILIKSYGSDKEDKPSKSGESRVLGYNFRNLNQKMGFTINQKQTQNGINIAIKKSDLERIFIRIYNTLNNSKSQIKYYDFWKIWSKIKNNYREKLIDLRSLNATKYTKEWELNLESMMKNAFLKRVEDD